MGAWVPAFAGMTGKGQDQDGFQLSLEWRWGGSPV